MLDKIHAACSKVMPKDRVHRIGDVLLLRGSCLTIYKQVLSRFPGSIDLWVNDPPYGTTNISWDFVIPLTDYWAMTSLVKDDAAMVVFGSQPFTSTVVSSNIKQFRHAEVWDKGKCGSPGLAKYRPMKVHEDILVFSRKPHRYFPQMEKGKPFGRLGSKDKVRNKRQVNTHGYGFKLRPTFNVGTRYPTSILKFSRNFSAQQQVHPTQKPTTLLEWLLKSYSQPGELVIDITSGSGSLGAAAISTGRKAILIERNSYYFELQKEWLKRHARGLPFDAQSYRKKNPHPQE